MFVRLMYNAEIRSTNSWRKIIVLVSLLELWYVIPLIHKPREIRFNIYNSLTQDEVQPTRLCDFQLQQINLHRKFLWKNILDFGTKFWLPCLSRNRMQNCIFCYVPLSIIIQLLVQYRNCWISNIRFKMCNRWTVWK